MRTTVYILFLYAVSHLTQKHNCLNLIELPITIQSKSNRPLKPVHPYRSIEHSMYVSDTSKNDRSRNHIKKTRRIPTVPTNVKYDNLNNYEKIPPKSDYQDDIFVEVTKGQYPPIRQTTPKFDIRRYFLVNSDGNLKVPNVRAGEYEDEKDANLKNKISTLVQQTIHDTDRKIKSIQQIKDKHRQEAPYKAGFILSMIKKSRDVLNELFNVAVKHKDEWKALEQLKIFELIVHTNVDTTNLVRQLVEIHIQHLNATNSETHDGNKEGKEVKSRVVLLK